MQTTLLAHTGEVLITRLLESLSGISTSSLERIKKSPVMFTLSAHHHNYCRAHAFAYRLMTPRKTHTDPLHRIKRAQYHTFNSSSGTTEMCIYCTSKQWCLRNWLGADAFPKRRDDCTSLAQFYDTILTQEKVRELQSNTHAARIVKSI